MTQTIHANGIDIAYDLQGPADAPVVMLSNSLMSNYTMWDDQLPALTPKYRVLRYDQRGHGGTTTTPGPYTVELMTDDAHALARALGIGRFHFVGLSMGGFSGQMMAFRHPQSVISLVLCDTACVMPPESLWNERIRTAKTEGMPGLVEGTLGRWFTPPFHETGKDGTGAGQGDDPGDRRRGLRRVLRWRSATCSSATAWATSAVPTLVLVGEDDPGCPVSAAETLHAGIAGSELKVIKRASPICRTSNRPRHSTTPCSIS